MAAAVLTDILNDVVTKVSSLGLPPPVVKRKVPKRLLKNTFLFVIYRSTKL